MYIFELITKTIKNTKQKSLKNNLNFIDYEEECCHTFYPIDSTSEILACSKCGHIVKSKDMIIKAKNPFS